MEAAIATIVSQFKAYAGNEGSSTTLSKDEFHKLVTSQLSSLVKVCLFSCFFVSADILYWKKLTCIHHWMLFICSLLI